MDSRHDDIRLCAAVESRRVDQVEREVAERFERIEKDLELAARAMSGLVRVVETTNQQLGSLIASVNSYIDASNARMTRLEENLYGLIRAITAEHQNGRSKLQ